MEVTKFVVSFHNFKDKLLQCVLIHGVPPPPATIQRRAEQGGPSLADTDPVPVSHGSFLRVAPAGVGFK